jgi:hypothetical protein
MRYVPQFKFTRSYIIAGLDEQDARERFQEDIDATEMREDILDADLWEVVELPPLDTEGK